MKKHATDSYEGNFLDDMFVRYPLALGQMGARIVTLAMSFLKQDSQNVAFEIPIDIVIEGGTREEKQYAELRRAQMSLVQVSCSEITQPDGSFITCIPLFNEVFVDGEAQLIGGEFNPHLRSYMLYLKGRYTTVGLEALFMLR